MSKIDKYGVCPNCGVNWEGSEVHEEINSLNVFSHKSTNEVKTIAGEFGWSEDNKVKFSRVIVIQAEEKTFYQCPEIRCAVVYDTETGISYASIEEATRPKVSVYSINLDVTDDEYDLDDPSFYGE